MTQDQSFDFTSLSPQAEVERSVAELRYGRPVIMRDGNRRIATPCA